MTKEYAVCKLPQEGDDMINVCSNWLLGDGNQTMYPPKSLSGSLKKLLKNKVSPTSTWRKYPVVVMGYYETFEKAEEKLRKACDTSNLESSDEEEARKSRNKRKKKSFSKEFSFLEDQSSDENDVPQQIHTVTNKPTSQSNPPPYPPLTSFQTIEINKNLETFSNTTPHTPPTAYSSKNKSSAYNFDIPNTVSSSPSHSLNFLRKVPSLSVFQNSESSTSSSPTQFLREEPTTPSSHRNPHSALFTSPGTSSLASQALQPPFTVSDRTILNQVQITLADVCFQQKKILEKLDQLTALAVQKHVAEERLEPAASLSDMFGVLPLGTSAEFEEFQDQLDDQMAKQFVRLLTSVGGKDLQQAIHNMLRRIMTDQLATKFSFSGKTMAGIIAVQKVFGGKEATETKFASIVAKWLQQAKTRADRRGKKRPLGEVFEADGGNDGDNL